MSTFDPSLAKEKKWDFSAKAKPGPGPVIAHLPASLTGGVALEILFRPPDQVDVRPADSDVWTPIDLVGGSVEVRVR